MKDNASILDWNFKICKKRGKERVQSARKHSAQEGNKAAYQRRGHPCSNRVGGEVVFEDNNSKDGKVTHESCFALSRAAFKFTHVFKPGAWNFGFPPDSFLRSHKEKKDAFDRRLDEAISTMSYKADDIIVKLEKKLEELRKKNAQLQK